jgi:hypothetical protein
VIAKLSALQAGAAKEARQQAEDQAQVAEVMIIIGEIKVWIERNQRNKRAVQAEIDRMMEQMQRGIQAIMSMLDGLTKSSSTLDGGTRQSQGAFHRRLPAMRDRKLEVLTEVGNLLDAAILLQGSGKPGAAPQQKPGGKPGAKSPAGGQSSGKGDTDAVYSIVTEAQRRLQTI